jgi:membrane-bound lytic murein transglycosylase D
LKLKVKKKRLYIFAALFSAFCLTAQAQTDDKTVTVNENGKEEKIDVPEAMTTDLDSLMNLYKAKTYLKPDTDCNMPDINPVYDSAVYKARLAKLPTIIEMPYNGIVQAFIDRYTGQLRRKVAYMLGAQNFYLPVFEEALESYNLPLELKYLPVIESALDPNAKSHAGAVGLWQFMLKTARRYDLKVNSLVDERRDLVRSSYAAAHYLSDLYKTYGDWNLVISAYNCGKDQLNKAISRSHGAHDYWKIYPKLPAETRGYVPAFIAANYVMNYYCDHNICPLTTDLPKQTDTVMVNHDIHFEQIAQVLNISVDELQDLNPQYRRNIVNGRSGLASLRLPEALIPVFIEKEDSILNTDVKDYKPKRTEVEVAGGSDNYTVNKNKVVFDKKKDDTKKVSAEKDDSENVSADNSDNDDNNDASESKSSSRRHSSKRSSRSSSKSSSKSSKSSSKSKKNKKTDNPKNVSVKSGDTLSEIAERNHTTVSKLKKLNKISGSNIRAGKKIRVK